MKKVINFPEISKEKKEKQLRTINNIDSLINHTYSKYKSVEPFIKILKNEYDKIVKKINNNIWLGYDDINLYLRDVGDFLTNIDSYDENLIDIVPILIYTNIVNVSKEEVLFKDISLKKILISTYYDSEVQASYYKRFNNLFLNDEISNRIEELNCDGIDVKAYLQCVIDQYDFKDESDTNLKNTISYLDEVKEDFTTIKDDRILKEDEKSLDVIHDEIKKYMDELDNGVSKYYLDSDYKSLEKISNINHISPEKRNEFIETIHIIDGKDIMLTTKLSQMIILIEIYSNYKKSNIIEVDFSKKNRK